MTSSAASGPDLRPLARRLAITLLATSTIYGLNLAFYPLWLQSRGLSAEWIGVMMALPTAAVILSNPLICAFADRHNRIAGCFLFSGLSIPIGFSLMAFSPNLFWLLAAGAVMAVARAPLLTLSDALAFSLIRVDPRIDYGRLRIWVSLAVLGVMAGGGFVVERIAPGNIIWFMICVTSVGAAAALWFAPRDHEIEAPPGLLAGAASGAFRGMARPAPALMLIIAAAALVQGSHAVQYAFGSLHWRAQGFGDTFIGLAWAVGVAAEIMLFAVAGRLGVERRPELFLIAGAGGAIIRWIAMALDPGAAGIVALQAMHIFSFCATHLGTIYLLTRMAPPHARAQAQGWLQSSVALATMVATVASGALFERSAELAYFVMAGLAGLGLALALVSARRQPQSAGSGG